MPRTEPTPSAGTAAPSPPATPPAATSSAPTATTVEQAILAALKENTAAIERLSTRLDALANRTTRAEIAARNLGATLRSVQDGAESIRAIAVAGALQARRGNEKVEAVLRLLAGLEEDQVVEWP
ncbi:hypothetical protein Q8F55_004447 [Vanrija albida]|uniref:REM-1 domain-containing protein n=1 Tax=Vanrija albida TaxID=181172 RepID=A0ABR3Q709_9TREE